jgi:hypothetical protein
MSAVRNSLRRRPRWLVIVVAVYGPLLIGGGVWLFLSSLNGQTETVSAQVSTSYAGRDTYVDFKFADGSTDSEFAPRGGSFFDAVAEFGPGRARVTRIADTGTIDTVVFHDKKYELATETDGVYGGIAAVLFGILGLGYAIRHRHRIRRGAPQDDPAAPRPASGSPETSSNGSAS